MMKRDHRFGNAFAMVLLCGALCLALTGAGPKSGADGDNGADPPTRADDDGEKDGKSNEDSGSWHKVKAASGNVKQTVTMVKFQSATPTFRLKINATPLAGASFTQFRAQLMYSSALDADGKPANWGQRQLLTERAEEVVREFDGGLDKNGEPRWFAVFVSGYGARYEVLVEDKAVKAKSSAKKSKKKSE